MRKMATMTTTTKAAFTQGCSTEQAVDKEIRPVAVVMTTLKSTTFSQSEPFFGPNHTGGGKVWEMIWSHASLLYHKHYHLQQRQHKSPFSGLLRTSWGRSTGWPNKILNYLKTVVGIGIPCSTVVSSWIGNVRWMHFLFIKSFYH